MTAKLASLLLIIIFASSCGTRSIADKLPNVGNAIVLETATIQKDIADDEIRPGYTLSIRHSVDKKLSGSFKVNWDGTITLPYGKTLQTTDKNVTLLAEELKEAYAGIFNSGNSFSVSIAQRNFAVEIRGLVKKPGSLLIKPTTTLEEIMARSELDKDQADYIRIELGDQSQWIDLKQYNSGMWSTDKMPKWAGGETLWFVHGDSNFTKGSGDIRMMGEVNQPGAFSFQLGKNVLDYVALAGGLKSSANVETIYIYRPVDGTRQVIEHFSLLDPQDFSLAPGDTLLVTNDRMENVERRFQMGANLAAILSAIGILILAL